MASGITNRGRKRMLDGWFRGGSIPTKFRMILVTAAAAPTVDTNTVSELTEIAAGNGYTSGGIDIERSAVGFDVLTEDDTNDRALIQCKDASWTGAGGTIPGSGGAARYAVLIDDNATLGSADVLAWWDLGSGGVTIGDGILWKLQDAEQRVA